MSPELLAIISSSVPDGPVDAVANGDDLPSIGGPLQSQHNNHHQIPPSHDPFCGPPLRVNGEGGGALGGGGLFQKLNESRGSNLGSVIPLGGVAGANLDALETPTGPGADFEARTLIGGDISDGVVMSVPGAPLRVPTKSRSGRGAGMDFTIDASSKVRSVTTRAKSRMGGEGEDVSDGTVLTRTTASMALPGERKRTISGHITQSSSTQVQDPTAAPQRRSVRLFNQIRPTSNKLTSATGLGLRESRDVRKAKATGTKGRSTTAGSTVGRVVSGNRKNTEPMDIDSKEGQIAPAPAGLNGLVSRSNSSEVAKQQEALQWLLALFKYLGGGYFALTHFHCQEALQIFGSVPTAQRDTPWVLAQIGRAQYEQASYAEAERTFKKIRALAHSRVEDMEIYSTVLWHLKNEIELAYLAHELMDIDRLSPQAWCAIGNTFSLQREHDQALKCFKRATQVDPKFAYAFTLQGHEHVANEEYDKALTAYRNSVSADNRHYNAWYGLGNVYEKMGKYDVAEKHFRTAIRINPTNAVLICCLGVVSSHRFDIKISLTEIAT